MVEVFQQTCESAVACRLTYDISPSPEDFSDIFRLRYRAYLDEGAIAPNAGCNLFDGYDASPNALTCAVRRDGRIVGSIRLHLISRDMPISPAATSFGDLILPMLQGGRLAIDSSRLVVDPTLPRSDRTVVRKLFRLPFIAALAFDAINIAAVRKEHKAYYLRAYRCKCVGPERTYPQLLTPLALLTGDVRETYSEIVDHTPALRPREGEVEAKRAGLLASMNRGASPQLLERLTAALV